MLGVTHITAEIYRDFLVGSKFSRPEEIFSGYRLAFIMQTLLFVPTRIEIRLSRHREISLCKCFIFKFPATSSILLVSEISWLSFQGDVCVY